jgi:hypothetical protein
LLPPADQSDRFFRTAATDFDIRREAGTDCRALGAAENAAQVFDRELHATFASRFAIRHAGNRRTDGRGNAASATAFTAFHDERFLATGDV